MQIVFDFIAGDIPFDEFWDAYCADPKSESGWTVLLISVKNRLRKYVRILCFLEFTVPCKATIMDI